MIRFLISFLLLTISTILTYAPTHAPGGVSGLRIWYVTAKENDKNILKDLSGNNRPAFAYSQGEARNRNINFHPVVFFDGSNHSETYENFAFNQGTIVGVVYPGLTGNNGKNFLSIRFNNSEQTVHERVVEINGRSKFQFGNDQQRNSLLVQSPATTKETAMKTVAFQVSTGKIYNSVWGEEKKTVVSSNFVGYLPEILFYNRVLTPLQLSQAQSYLAIKYGITLDSSYIDSKGETLWNIKDATLRKYHHRVCAIGQDASAGIWQPKSNTAYEEAPFSAYDFDADKTSTVGHFIPKEDSASLYRSLTISFKDRTLNGVGERGFLFWGDDNLSINEHDYYRFNQTGMPNLFLMKRNWAMYNKETISQPTRVVIAGSDYRKPSMFSNKLYHPYDYQLYRYLIIKWKTPDKQQIKELLLCDYFGRDQLNSDKFNTRSIVWDNVTWGNSTATTFFTFGRVPLLNFLQIGKNSTNLIALKYPFSPKRPIASPTIFDTLTRPLVFRRGEQATAYFSTSEGVPPLLPKLYVITRSGKKEIPDAIRLDKGGEVVPEVSQGSNDSNDETTDAVALPVGTAVTDEISEISRHKPVIQQKRTGFRVTRLLPSPATYVIEIRDQVGQFTSIPFKTAFTL